jgi:hypothetical protein
MRALAPPWLRAREAWQDPFDAIMAVIPWERFRASVAEAEALARPEDFDSYEMLGERAGDAERAVRQIWSTESNPLNVLRKRKAEIDGLTVCTLILSRKRRILAIPSCALSERQKCVTQWSAVDLLSTIMRKGALSAVTGSSRGEHLTALEDHDNRGAAFGDW